MTSVTSLERKVEKLERELAITPKKIACAFVEEDGFVYPRRQHGSSNLGRNLRWTPEDYTAKMKDQGFTHIHFIRWAEPGDEIMSCTSHAYGVET